eukprot:15473319-Alexandrium_andersonii.AAC.1
MASKPGRLCLPTAVSARRPSATPAVRARSRKSVAWRVHVAMLVAQQRSADPALRGGKGAAAGGATHGGRSSSDSESEVLR